MLTTYFKRPTTQSAYYSGPAGPYLDGFSDWLAQRGYQHETVCHRLHGAARLEGDLDYRVEVPADDELGILVDSFNRMTADRKVCKRALKQADKRREARAEP